MKILQGVALYLGTLSALLIIIIFLFKAESVSAESNYDNYGLGVLDVRSQSIIQSLRLTLPIVVPGSIKKGVGLHVDNTWTNVWAENEHYLMDYEMVETNLGLSFGTNNNFKFRLDFTSRNYIGGGMDNLIQNAHDLEGISQNGRDDYPRNRCVISIYDEDTGTWTTSDADELNNQGASFLISYDLPGNWFFPAINIYSTLRYNIESANFIEDLDDFDFGFGVGLAKRITERVFVYSVLGYSLFNDEVNTNEETLVFHKSQRSVFLAIAWHYNPSISIVLQYLYGEAMVKNINGLNEDSHEIHVGTKMRLLRNLYMDFSIIENTINMDNSPDFGFHLGFSLYLN